MHAFFNIYLCSLLASSSRELAMGVYERGTEEVRDQGKGDLFAPKEYQVAGDLITADIRVRRTLQKVAEDSSG